MEIQWNYVGLVHIKIVMAIGKHLFISYRNREGGYKTECLEYFDIKFHTSRMLTVKKT